MSNNTLQNVITIARLPSKKRLPSTLAMFVKRAARSHHEHALIRRVVDMLPGLQGKHWPATYKGVDTLCLLEHTELLKLFCYKDPVMERYIKSAPTMMFAANSGCADVVEWLWNDMPILDENDVAIMKCLGHSRMVAFLQSKGIVENFF